MKIGCRTQTTNQLRQIKGKKMEYVGGTEWVGGFGEKYGTKKGEKALGAW